MNEDELIGITIKPRTWWTAVRHFFGVWENGEMLANDGVIVGT
jgi:hypothetical protein